MYLENGRPKLQGITNGSITVITLAAVTLLSKTTGFIREISLASVHGASIYTDAYIISNSILDIFISLFTPFGTVFIPIYLKAKLEKGKYESLRYVSKLTNLGVILGFAFLVMGFIFKAPLTRIYAVGFSEKELLLTVDFVRLILPVAIFTPLTIILMSFLNANGRFYMASLSGIVCNAAIIFGIFLSRSRHVNLLIYFTAIGYILQLLLLLVYAFFRGFRYIFSKPFIDKSLLATCQLALPVLSSVCLLQVNNVIDRTLASTLKEGSITALSYARIIDLFVFGVITVSLSTVLYQRLSEIIANGQTELLPEIVTKYLNSAIIILLPIVCIVMSFTRPIIELIYKRGAFDVNAVGMTSVALFFYGPGIVGFGLRELLTRVYYSFQDSKTPMLNTITIVVINGVLSLLLINFLGIGGIAAATSISSIIGALLLGLSLHKKIQGIKYRRFASIFIKCTVSSIAMVLIITILQRIIILVNPGCAYILQAILLSVIGVIFYSAFLILFRVIKIKLVVQYTKKFISKGA